MHARSPNPHQAEPIFHLHYGNAMTGHHPLQTVRFLGTADALLRRIREARRTRWPLTVQVGTQVYDATAFQARVFGIRPRGATP